MALNAQQLAELGKPLDKKHIAQRSQAGVALSYIEGHHAIREANRIFGFDCWSRETLDIACVSQRERKVGKQQRNGWSVTYTAKVRVVVNGVVREGSGAGHGVDVDCGQAHESALKEAETDAMKRALMTFGDPFGLALYDKDKTHVVDGQAEQRAAKEAAHKRAKAEEWTAGFITSLKGKSFDEGVQAMRNAERFLRRLPDDLADRINEAAKALPADEKDEFFDDDMPDFGQVEDGDPAAGRGAPKPFQKINGEAHNAS